MTNKLPEILVARVKTRWLDLWHAKLADGADAHVQLWYQAIMDVLAKAGYDILTAELLSEEKAISMGGLSEDYVDALIAVTGATEANTMALVTATSEQRLRACKAVRAYQHTQLPLTKGEH